MSWHKSPSTKHTLAAQMVKTERNGGRRKVSVAGARLAAKEEETDQKTPVLVVTDSLLQMEQAVRLWRHEAVTPSYLRKKIHGTRLRTKP